MAEAVDEIRKLSSVLDQVRGILQKDTAIWPYQQMDIHEFMRKFFPDASSAKDVEKYKNLNPPKLIQAIENKLRTIDAILKPLEDRLKALEFQHRLLSYFAIYSPKKLKDCQKILNKTPRGIREGFTSEKNLELASNKGFSQKAVAEIMTLWLNMRYYGALSCGLSPKFLLRSVKDVASLRTKLQTIEATIQNIQPKVEDKHNEYSIWVFKKQRIDEERKLMTFGPENVQTLETVLQSIHRLSLAGEITQNEAMDLVNKAKYIIEEAIKLGAIEKKTLISKEKQEKLTKIIQELYEKPKLFFIIAQITNFIQNGRTLTKDHLDALQKIDTVINMLPETTAEVLENETLVENLRIIFEPLKLSKIEHPKPPKRLKKKRKRAAKKSGVKKTEEIELLKEIFDQTAKWVLTRIIAEKKAGLENLIKIFRGIPIGLGTHIAHLVMNKTVKIKIDSLKDCLISYLGNSGVYELYTQLGKAYQQEAEIEVADEIAIPPQADQRLAPIQKQLKFEFMKYMETAKIGKTPLFNILETQQIPPIKFVDLLLEESQQILVNIINYNADHKLHELMELKPDEFEVRLKTLNMKLSSFMKDVSTVFERIISKELQKKKFHQQHVFKTFGENIKEIWIKNLIRVKKIEPKEEPEIATSKVSALAAKLEGGIKKQIPKGIYQGPPRATPPSTSPRPAPPRAAPPSTSPRPAPPRAAPPSTSPRPAPPRAAPPSTSPRPAPPRATPPSTSPRPAPSRAAPPSTSPHPAPPNAKRPTSHPPSAHLAPTLSTTRRDHPSITTVSSPESSQADNSSEKEISSEIISVDFEDAPDTFMPQLIDLNASKSIDEIKIQENSSSRLGTDKTNEPISNTALEDVSEYPLPDFAKAKQAPHVNIATKTTQLKETIEEAMKLVEASMVEMDILSPESLKNALQLVYQLHVVEKTDIATIDPSKIREITDLAESLKRSKETIILQKTKLKHLETKLNDHALSALDAKLELIAKIYDEFIQDLEFAIAQLSGKGEKLIQHFGKKGGKDYRVRRKIKKEGQVLAQHVDLLKKFGELTRKQFKEVKTIYIAFQKAREEHKNQLIKKYSQTISEIVGIDRKAFLTLTRDPKLKNSLNQFFKIN
ncbi:MAG: hypothetical protein ACTSRC_06615 [Candidatus Helarchaeota archaeon]